MRYLFQHADEKQSSLLDISAPVHTAYCKAWGWQYVRDGHRLLSGYDLYWEKIRILRDFLKQMKAGDEALFLDAECLIVRPGIELFMGQPYFIGNEDPSYSWTIPAPLPEEADMALAAYPNGAWNSGVIFLRNNLWLLEFFEQMLADGPVSDEEWAEVKLGHSSVGWEERRLALNFARQNKIQINSLDSRWNFGNAIRPLIGQAQERAVIIHPSEKPLAIKANILTRAVNEVIAGKPFSDWTPGGCC
jgi:hypothetical protein